MPAAYQHYYNEWERYPAQWLRNLADDGEIPNGIVDETDIREVKADDIRNATQAHFFAGIGGWPYALKLAGWPTARPVWTGSCPCQPFSEAGERGGFNDERHLWPYFRDLISQCLPPTVFGEQVAHSPEWLGLVRSDLEALGYAVGCMPIEAASAGAYHLRERFWFVADRSGSQTWKQEPRHGKSASYQEWSFSASSTGRFISCVGRSYRLPEPGISFVVDGFPECVAQVSAFGNAIDPRPAAAFINAFMDIEAST